MAGSMYMSVRYRRLCRVFHRDGLWCHRYPDGFLVEPQISLATIRELDHRAVDCFMYGYAPNAGDIVVDVGAGSGLEALPFSRRVSATGRVVAIEAHPLVFRCLEEVCRLNRLLNVTAVHGAVGPPTTMA